MNFDFCVFKVLQCITILYISLDSVLLYKSQLDDDLDKLSRATHIRIWRKSAATVSYSNVSSTKCSINNQLNNHVPSAKVL